MAKKSKQKNNLWLRGRTWWLSYRHGGTTVRESSGSTRKEDAKAMLDTRRVASRQGQLVAGISKVTMADLFTLYLADAAAKHRAPPRLHHLGAFFGVVKAKAQDGTISYNGGEKAQTVTYAVLQRYVAARQKAGAADATISNELASVRRAFRLGRKAGRVAVVPDVPMPHVENVRESYFTVAQLDRLLTLLPDYLRAPVQFAASAGWRAGNVFALEWEHVDFGRGVVRVPIGRTKSGEPATTPFAHESALDRLLRAQQQAQVGPFVFHHAGERIRSYHASWRTAVKALGKKDAYGEQYDPKTGTTQKVLKRFHDLRHTFAQMMTDAGVAEAEILALGSWQTPAMLRRYRIVNEDRKKAAAAQMEQHIVAERNKAAGVLTFKKAGAR